MKYREYAERVLCELFDAAVDRVKPGVTQEQTVEFLARCFEKAAAWRPGDPVPALRPKTGGNRC